MWGLCMPAPPPAVKRERWCRASSLSPIADDKSPNSTCTTHINVRIYIYVHIHTCARMHVHIHTHTHNKNIHAIAVRILCPDIVTKKKLGYPVTKKQGLKRWVETDSEIPHTKRKKDRLSVVVIDFDIRACCWEELSRTLLKSHLAAAKSDRQKSAPPRSARLAESRQGRVRVDYLTLTVFKFASAFDQLRFSSSSSVRRFRSTMSLVPMRVSCSFPAVC